VEASDNLLAKSGAKLHLHGATATFVAGGLAGVINAVMINPLSFIKYQSWGTIHHGRLWKTAVSIYQTSGPTAFMHGVAPTIYRDMLWGGLYNLLRNDTLPRLHKPLTAKNPRWWGFVDNMGAALIATATSSPLNFVRNVRYGSSPESMQSTYSILKGVWKEGGNAPEGRLWHLQQRFVIGWGTLRVAVGMAFASQIYEFCTRQTEVLETSKHLHA
jgi:hypothetical protein